MSRAPIIFFVFNRHVHAQKTIDYLLMNPLAKESELYIFSDGPRNEDDMDSVKKTRNYIDSIEGFKEIYITKSEANKGLAASVISGVTSIIDRYDKVIVIEDDLEVSPYFLDYMNEALLSHERNSRVFSIGGYSPPIEIPDSYKEDSYLSYRCCTWGWGTWKDRWDKVDWDVEDYAGFINNPELVAFFNRGGDDMSNILRLQMEGKVDSWGIRWDYAHYKNNAYCFRPTLSLVNSFGNDGSGVHCGKTDKFTAQINRKLNFSQIRNLTLNEEINQRFADFYSGKKKAAVAKAVKATTDFRVIVKELVKRLVNWIRKIS